MIAARNPFPFRSAGPCAAEAPAPEVGSSSLPDSGAGHLSVLAAISLPTGRAEGRDAHLGPLAGLQPAAEFTGEGDLVAVPAFERAGISRFQFCAGRAEAARRSPAAHHSPEVAGSNPAPETTIPCEAEKGRQAVPSGGLPLPQGPP